MNDKDFISKMVHETLEGATSQNVEDVNFLQSSFFEIKAKYDYHKKCYIIWNTTNEALEIPENWGPFKNRISTEFTITKAEDKFLFLDILSLHFEQNITNLKISLENRGDRFALRKAA